MPITHLGNLSDAGSATTYNLGSVVAAEGGLLVVAACGRSGSSLGIAGITIGGVAATQVEQAAADSIWARAIYSRVVSAGSHAISVTFSGSSLRCGVAAWLITGYASETPTDTDNFSTTGSASSSSLSLTFPADGMAVYLDARGASSITGTWSAASEDADVAIESFACYGAAHKVASGADTETVSLSSSIGQRAGVAAVWEPVASGGNRRRRSLICGAA